MTKIVDRRSSDEQLRQIAQPVKRGTVQLIEVEWAAADHPSKAGQQNPKPGWDVVVRDWHGGEFCRRSFATKDWADSAEAQLRRKLIKCNGAVLDALSAWAGRKIQLPLWWR